MKISNATVDCWLYVSEGTDYSDFQHHHWDIGPSGQIDTAVGNRPDYTWSGFGSVGSESWNAIGQSLTSQAEVRITSPPMGVSLTQTAGPLSNTLQATDSDGLTHEVGELTWPGGIQNPEITWVASALTSSASITYQDMDRPIYRIVTIPGLLVGKKTLRTLAFEPGVGGRDYSMINATYWQAPSGASKRAWWAWTINLAP